MTLISVIITSYNRYEKLVRCVSAVKNQKLPKNYHLEIIVVNDGSDEKEYYEQKIDGVTQINISENTGKLLGYTSVGFVRNCGIRISRGEWLAFCDDDDIWLPKKLTKQLQVNTKVCVSDAYRFREKTRPTQQCERYNEHYKVYYKSIYPRDFQHGFPKQITLRILEKHNVCILSSLFIHRSMLSSVGLFDEKHPFREFFEDWDYLKRLATITPIVYIDEPLLFYEYK